jgi:hypothetical protein
VVRVFKNREHTLSIELQFQRPNDFHEIAGDPGEFRTIFRSTGGRTAVADLAVVRNYELSNRSARFRLIDSYGKLAAGCYGYQLTSGDSETPNNRLLVFDWPNAPDADNPDREIPISESDLRRYYLLDFAGSYARPTAGDRSRLRPITLQRRPPPRESAEASREE